MSKIIIHNRSSLDDVTALARVASVVNGGRISGESYCYATTFTDGSAVTAHRNANSDRFDVLDWTGGTIHPKLEETA